MVFRAMSEPRFVAAAAAPPRARVFELRRFPYGSAIVVAAAAARPRVRVLELRHFPYGSVIVHVLFFSAISPQRRLV